MGGGDPRTDDPRIAVIGTAFRLPGADTPEDLWRVVHGGEDRFTRFTDAELRAAGVPEELYRRDDFVGVSALLDDIAGFDARHFGMSAREAALTDPQQRLFLECAQHALENAGYPDERDGSRIGVFASAGYHLYTLRSYLLGNVLPSETVADWLAGFQVLVGNFTDFNATRVAYRLDLTGPAVNVQTACSSSLVGVQLAAQSLLMGDCDIALAGAAAVHVPQVLGHHYVKGSILSKSGRLRAFDAAADGTVGGTGVAAVVLKRLSRALADGDTVHGVIRGWGIGNDGAGKKAYSAPSARGQRIAIRRALDHAGVTADTIGYLETHGTGTRKGDPIELEGARAAFREDTDRSGYCALGAVKANIGHLDVASGVAGLIKTLLVLERGVIPPIAGFEERNPLLELDDSPFYVPRSPRAWPEGGTPRRAGLTSLGVGGTNVHLVLEAAPAPLPRAATAAPPDVLLVSATCREALVANARSLRDVLRVRNDLPLADLVTTAALGRSHGRHRIAVRGGTPAALADALDAWLSDPDPPSAAVPEDGTARTLFQFTGQGALRAGAAAELYGRFPVVREVLDACEEQHLLITGEPLLADLLAGGADRAPWPTETGQPALFALQCALVRLWAEAGITPSAVTGHSVGEYAALHAAGSLSLADGLRLVTRRGRLTAELSPPGAMVAVALARDAALELAAGEPGVELAATNGAGSQVLAGPVADVDRMCARLDELGLPHERLAVDRAFHTAQVEPMLDAFGTALDATPFAPVRIPFISAVDGLTRPPGWIPDRHHLVRHAREPVRYDEALRSCAGQRPDVLLEIGPHATLSALARRALGDVRAVPSLRRGSGRAALYDAAVALHRAGADVRWEAFLAGTGGRRVPLPGYRFQHRPHWIGPPPRPPAPPAPPVPAKEERTMTTNGTRTTDTPRTTPLGRTGPAAEAGPAARNGHVDGRADGHILDGVLRVLSRSLGEDPASVPVDASFFDLGADSLLMINVLREIEQDHGVGVTMRELFDETGTPRLLAELIASRLPQGAPPSVATDPSPAAPPVADPPVTDPPPAPPTPPADAAGFATRQELQDLAVRVQQLSQIQLQMLTQLTQLTQLLALRNAGTPAGPDEGVER
ncbi:type I polyketide synthase [Streptomyces radicis]|uniref:Acyltransferase domain-containing protein n=1 Tax=Streptomyces radicis TaxID=1750517 RepID=A0A3A9VXN7_9ACTN|nr:type I polyketide synthase [Streptomyces radicis]RKN05785.1 acyltransferase domain-containing protein [Streptomyces radicis]RKN17660.1 acyltransferase domain-containing protein [Streptomyces radicis]